MNAIVGFSLVGGALLVAATSAVAQNTVQKADTPIFDFLNVGTSWVGGNVPAANDLAQFDSVMATPANNMNRIGGDMEVRGITVSNPAAVNVSSGYSIAASVITSPSFAYAGTLSIGDLGIQLVAGSTPPEIRNWFFNIGCPIAITRDTTTMPTPLIRSRLRSPRCSLAKDTSSWILTIPSTCASRTGFSWLATMRRSAGW